MATYDLLPKEYQNDTFVVVFDIYTPRPHFIITPRVESGNVIGDDFSKMKDEETRQVLIKTAWTMSPNGILSIHRGSWISTDVFHAHVCVDTESYLKIFEQKKDVLRPKYKDYFLNIKYPSMVRTPSKNKYFGSEVKAIENLRQNPPGVTEVPAPGEGLRIIYHREHPKIGFVAKNDEIELHDLIWKIERVAQQLGLTTRLADPKEKRDENKGGQVCLYLGSATKDWPGLAEGEHVIGYIVTTGPTFYQLCPERLRENWFQKFRNSNFMCKT